MNLWNTVLGWGKSAWHGITGIAGSIGNVIHAGLQFMQSILNIVVDVVSNPTLGAYVALGALADLLTGNLKAVNNMINRLPSWTQKHQVNPLKALMLRMFRQLEARIAYLFAVVYWYINLKIRETRAYALALVMKERSERIADFKRSEAYTRAQVKAAVQLIERQAVGGYTAGDQGRTGIIGGLLDDIAARKPAISSLTSRIFSIVLDLAAIEDPVARWLVGLLMNRVLADLGVDRAIGNLVQSLIGQLTGGAPPKDLRGVIDDLTARMVVVEGQWATFMRDGGPQILQAGEEWKKITSVLADAGLIAFAVAGATDPAETAKALSDIIRPVGTGAISSIAAMLGRV